MKIVYSDSLSLGDKDFILKLWNNEYPSSIQHKDMKSLDAYLNTLVSPKHYFLIAAKKTVGWYCDFDRDNARWFAMIIDRAMQGNGAGTKLIENAKKINTELNGWVVQDDSLIRKDGSVYPSPISFYKRRGFEITDKTWETEALKTVKIKWSV